MMEQTLLPSKFKFITEANTKSHNSFVPPNIPKINKNQLGQLYYFYCICKNGVSYRDTAILLGVKMPTLSEQIKKLENAFDQDLFIRYTRRTEMTNFGAWLFDEVSKIFEPFDELVAKANS